MSDPTLAAVSGVYTAMWNNYLNTELLFTATSNFVSLNDQAFQFWDFRHTDPAGAVQVPDNQGNPTLYTAGDLAATMAANPDLLVLSANGYYDAVTPFFQTKLTLDAMPLKNARARANLTIRYYPSGHMIYLDGGSRTALKGDLAAMYDASAAGGGRAGASRGGVRPHRPQSDPSLFHPAVAREPTSARRWRGRSPGTSPISAPPIPGRRASPAAASSPSSNWPADGSSPTSTPISPRRSFPRRRSSTSRSPGPATTPIRTAIRSTNPDNEVALDIRGRRGRL